MSVTNKHTHQPVRPVQPVRVPVVVLLLVPPLVLAVLVQVLAVLLDLDMVADINTN